MNRTTDAIRILHVDDEPDLVDLTATFLEREADRFRIETATSVREGLSILAQTDVDCIISDYDMPGQNGIEFLEAVRADYPDLPFILFTGKGSEEIASDAISAGVTDYLQKERGTSQYTVLANRVANAVEQYRSKRALEASQKRLSLFIEQSPLGVIEWDDEFNLVRLNDSAEDILGYSEAELEGRSWDAIVSEADQSAVREVVSELLEDKGGYHSINENVTKDGETIVCEWHNRVITDDSDETVAIFSQFQDVTDRRTQQNELEQTNALLSTLFETLPVGVLVEDSSRNVLAANQRMFELFDLPGSPEDIAGADCEQMAEEVSGMFVDSDGFVDRTNELVANQLSVWDEEWQLQNGETFARSHQLIELADGEGHLWVYHDVTDQTEREQRLEALNEMTRDLVTASTRETVVEIGVNAARDILNLDANAIHLYDDEQGGLVPVAATDAVYDLFEDLPTFTGDESIVWRAYQEGEPLAVDEVTDDPDVYNSTTPVRSELYLPIGELGILIASSPTPEAFDQQDLVLGEILAGNIATALEQVDQTERLRAREEELSRQNDRLEEFASVVSHDLRNPLNVANGRLELLGKECESDHVDHIDRAHTRMSALIDDLLVLARQGDRVSETEPVDLEQLTRSCWHNVATAETTITMDLDRRFYADRSRLQQLLENLFRNAVEHGGDDVTVGELADGFYVEDDGNGIPADDREMVFTAGYSTTEDGTGFGLSIVKQVADAHNWTIRVTEGSDGGARFEITGVEFVAE